MFYEVIGWIGFVCFSLSPVPQAIKSFKEKHANGVASYTLIFWMTGETACLVYVWGDKGFWSHLPLVMNYIFNIVFIAVIVYYKIKGSTTQTNDLY